MVLFQGVFLGVLLLIGAINHCMGQNQEYALMVGGRKIGALRVFSQDTLRSMKVFKVESEFKIMFQNGKFSNTSTYSNGKLVQAVSIHSLNGTTKEKTKTDYRAQRHYEVQFTDEEGTPRVSQSISEPIVATLTTLFYGEPKGVRSVYSERFGKFCAVSKLSAQDYKVQMPDGKHNIFSYRDGQFFEMQTEMAGFRLKVVSQ